ncbi:hypothetical protein ACFFQF_05085 [Haladaptatus pallidirubidus]|uniref:Uncharacterized protein n=1 Tax=Haladaptatus pallidirubidus TaxID=1008152 RepID=A0AAV3ULG6_9EURY|nr:hypothetical protein [Haladaptatus pallidirubidus]
MTIDSTEPTSTTTTPNWRRCEERRTPTAASHDGNVDQKPYPTVPGELTSQTVTSFVEETEQAYLWNRILERERNLVYIDIMSISITDSKHTETGFVVYLVAEFGYGTDENEDGEATVHADGAVKTSYLVNDRFVGRVESTNWEHVVPREAADGTVLWCLPNITDEDSA